VPIPFLIFSALHHLPLAKHCITRYNCCSYNILWWYVRITRQKSIPTNLGVLRRVSIFSLASKRFQVIESYNRTLFKLCK
jgi:hypothetical protein